MFNIEKELNEIRNIDVSPSRELIENTTKMVKKKSAERHELKKKARRSNIIKLSAFASLPAAAAVLLAIVIGFVTPQAAAYYTVDMGFTTAISVDEDGYVIDIDADESFDNLDEDKLKNQTIEYAISQVIDSADGSRYITDSTDVLIGCFGDDEHNNISKNQVMYHLEDASYHINLMSVHGTIEDWNNAQAADMSAGLYLISQLSGMEIRNDIELSALIIMAEDASGMSIATLLYQNAEPIHYTAPKLNYYIKDNYINVHWDYIDYKARNYDGDITYRLIAADTQDALANKPSILDTYTFASWDKQPISYTLPYNDTYTNKYYAIAAVYDDHTVVLLDEYMYIP